jgi:7-carboxy-7-deazaguanine synthase
MSSLRITEIFYSLQGEGKFSGLPTVFVRLTGCPLRCHYCDTEYAFHGGNILMVDQIIDQVKSFGAKQVCVTGGEPLAQKHCWQLLTELCDTGLSVSLETSGAISIEGVDDRVCVVMDLKTPASGEQTKNLMSNIDLLKTSDQIKFVVCDRNDYEWTRNKIIELKLDNKVNELLLSPSYGEIDLKALAAWILEDQLPVRMQIQMHKIIWNDAPGH